MVAANIAYERILTWSSYHYWINSNLIPKSSMISFYVLCEWYNLLLFSFVKFIHIFVFPFHYIRVKERKIEYKQPYYYFHKKLDYMLIKTHEKKIRLKSILCLWWKSMWKGKRAHNIQSILFIYTRSYWIGIMYVYASI